MWRAGWVRDENVLLWAQSLERLQREGDCEYIIWLLKRWPQVYPAEEEAETEGS